MKLTAFLLTVTCLQASAKGFGQEKMTIFLKDVKLKYAMSYIQRNTQYRFIYNDDLFAESIKVSVNARNATIEEVLNMLLRSTGLSFHVLGNNLIAISLLSAEAKPALPIKGKVTLLDPDNSIVAHSGVSIVEKGTTNGTTTNDLGEFTLTVKDAFAVLVISSVGYETVEAKPDGKQEVSVTLQPSTKQLQDVVVTALGITKQKRSITYATQTIKGTELSSTREVNLTSAMNGKVANMTISKTNAGPGSSNRIIFRGNRSITGSNQPLIVVDGVRIDNSPKAFNDVTANIGLARDNGDGISNINPDDVESMTVLTGASAAALYGSDASNGAIIVTTKKGRSGKGIGVQLSSSAMFENPMVYPKFQNVYGQGSGGVFDSKGEDSWGPKMQGQQVTDWTGKSQELNPQPDNFKNFFRTGSELINAISLSAGNEKAQTYFSYTNSYIKGILPNNDYRRNNFNLRQNVQITDRLSVDLKANYIVEDVVNRPMAGAANHAVATLDAMPRSLRIKDILNFEHTDPTDFSLKQNYWASQTPAFQNPYWSVYRNLYDRLRNRFIGLGSLKFQVTPELSILGRTSIDYYTDASEEKDYSGSYWITYAGQGNYVINKESNRQFNNDVLLTYTKDFLRPCISMQMSAQASSSFILKEPIQMTRDSLSTIYFHLATVSRPYRVIHWQEQKNNPSTRLRKLGSGIICFLILQVETTGTLRFLLITLPISFRRPASVQCWTRC